MSIGLLADTEEVVLIQMPASVAEWIKEFLWIEHCTTDPTEDMDEIEVAYWAFVDGLQKVKSPNHDNRTAN